MNGRVGCNKFKIVVDGLRDQHAGERVAMNERQAFGKAVNFKLKVEREVRNFCYDFCKRPSIFIWSLFALLFIFPTGNYRDKVRFVSGQKTILCPLREIDIAFKQP